MMTVIEKQYMDAVIAMNRRMQKNEIDWEQRRYEIAKEMMPVAYQESRNILLRGGDVGNNDIALAAVEFADMLIAELQKVKQ